MIYFLSLTCLIQVVSFKIEAMEAVLWLVKHIYFFDSHGIMILPTKVTMKFGFYHIFEPLNQANLTCFWHMTLQLIKKKHLDYILSIFFAFVVFHFSRKITIMSNNVDEFGLYYFFDPLIFDSLIFFDQANLICFWYMSSEVILKEEIR